MTHTFCVMDYIYDPGWWTCGKKSNSSVIKGIGLISQGITCEQLLLSHTWSRHHSSEVHISALTKMATQHKPILLSNYESHYLGAQPNKTFTECYWFFFFVLRYCGKPDSFSKVHKFVHVHQQVATENCTQTKSPVWTWFTRKKKNTEPI